MSFFNELKRRNVFKVGVAYIVIAWLEKSVQTESGGFDRASLFLKPLQDDARWLPLLESAGQSDAQLAAIPFHVTLPD